MKKWIYGFIFLLAALFLVACDEKPNNGDSDTVAPIINGVTDMDINFGDSFDPRAGVTAIDDVDGVVTGNIVITGTVNNMLAGSYILTYEVTDAAGNKATEKRTITVLPEDASDLFIKNGDFSEPLDGAWTHWAGEGGASTVSIVNGEAVIDITANGTQWYSTQFSQPGLTITQGKMYRLEFEARADQARGIVVKLEDSTYFGYIDELAELTTTMQIFTFEFFVLKPTINNGKLIFGGGTMASRGVDAGALTKVYLDNVVITEIDAGVDEVGPVIHGAADKNIAVNDAFDPLEGVTVTDNRDITLTAEDIVITGNLDITTPGEYVLTYTVSDAAGNETVHERTITVLAGLVPSTWLVVNGDFEEEQLSPLPQPAATGWGWHGAANFTAIIKDGVATLEINNLGGVVHGVQFYQQNRNITQGQIYKITFDAKALHQRPIMVALEEGTTRRFDEIVFLDNEWQTYTIYYEHVLSGFENGKFAFFMGDVGDDSVPTTVYLDNITVETVDLFVDNMAPQLYGTQDYVISKDSTFNELQGITLRENNDKTLTVEDIIITGTVNTAVIGEYSLTYTISDTSNNTSTYVRKIVVVENENMTTNTFEIVNGNFETEQLSPTPQPATTGWGWHGAGTFTIEIKDGIATIDVVAPGTVPHGVQFYLQNRVIETGATYLLTFKAKVDIPRSFRLSLEAGTDVRFFKVIDVTDEWATYQVYITPSGGGFTNGKLGFFMGYVDETSVPTTFYLDDIAISKVGNGLDEENPMIIKGLDKEINVGDTFDPLADIFVFDILDKTLTTASLVVTGSVNTELAGTYELTYTLSDSAGNTVTKVRTITVINPQT